MAYMWMMGSNSIANLNGMKQQPNCKHRRMNRDKKKQRKSRQQRLNYDSRARSRANNNSNNIVVKVIDVQAPIYLNADLSSFRLLVQEFTGLNSILNSSSIASGSHGDGHASSASPHHHHHHHYHSPLSSSSSALNSAATDCLADASSTCTFEDCIGQLIDPSSTSSSSNRDSINPVLNFDIEPDWHDIDIDRDELISNLKSRANHFPDHDMKHAADLPSDHHGNPLFISGYGSPTYNNIGQYFTTASINDQCSASYNLWDDI